MKKISITLFFVILAAFAFATHNGGGEITIKQLGYLHYEATIHTYTKQSSIPADRDSLEICWGDGICEWVPRDTFFLVGKDTKYNAYIWQHFYQEEGDYTVSMTDPNRTGGSLNLFLSDNIPFHIQTRLVVSSMTNNTPQLLNPPVDIGYLGAIYQHNPAAIDWEGDSLVYELTIPMQGVDQIVPGYTFPSPDNNPPNFHELDSELGTFIWDVPQVAGTYVLAIKIIEYRDGQILSETIRDFTIKIESNQNLAPMLDISIDEITLDIGDTLTFDVLGTDLENAEIYIQALGLPMLMENPATFSAPSDFSNSPISSNFFWEIFPIHASIDPYYLVFRIEERDPVNCGLTHYHVLKINILGEYISSTTELDERWNYSVFPNPVFEGFIHIKSNAPFDLENTVIQLFSLDGKLLLEKINTDGDFIEKVDIQRFISGSYLLVLRNETAVFSKIIIKN